MKLFISFLFFYFFIINFGLANRIPRQTASSWPAGAYCIFQGSGASCPSGFSLKSIRLSVQQNYKDSESVSDGKKAIITGNFGGSELKSLKFDDAYVLDLHTCCKDN